MAKSKKKARNVDAGRVYITATFNNTLITVTDKAGNPILTGSCGMYGFSGTRKSTPYAATVTVQATLKRAMDEYNMRQATIYINGIGPGRGASLRAIKALRLDVERILDVTPVPHNGVRPPKQRRG